MFKKKIRSDADADLLASVNRTAITGDTLIRVHHAITSRHEQMVAAGEKPDSTDALIAAIKELGKVDSDVVIAVMFRMRALAFLVADQSLGRWTLEVDGKEYLLIHEAVLRAAAEAPLRPSGDRLGFDASELVRLSLQLSEPDGHG